MKSGDRFDDDVLVIKSNVDTTKSGKMYVNFDCRTRKGFAFDGCKIWDSSCAPKAGTVIKVKGKIDEFNGSLQIKVKEWTPTQGETGDFQPQAPWGINHDQLHIQFDMLLGRITNEELREFIGDFIAYWGCHHFPSEAIREGPPLFYHHPGAIKVHHGYRHGLLEHTVEVMESAIAMAGPAVLLDRELDLLIAGCAIHDIGKLVEFEYKDGFYDYTPIGRAYGWCSSAHLFIGGQMLTAFCQNHKHAPSDDDFAILQNIILSHHGEWSPIKPMYNIAVLVHLADMASSNMNRMRQHLALSENGIVEKDTVRERYMRIYGYDENAA
jgi:3'-5' exoribonuclease